MTSLIILILAICLDFIFGDPGGALHPVALIGNLITTTEKWLYPKNCSPITLFFRGVFTSILVVSFVQVILILLSLVKTNYLIQLVFSAILLAFAFSICTLIRRGLEIRQLLEENNLSGARQKLAYIVSRDTANLTEDEIVRATIETLAENFTDSIVAPLFWFIIFGIPGAYFYRTVNTLDAMLGYHNTRYEYFGKFAAYLDDLLNFIPARISGILLILTGFILNFNIIAGIKTWYNEASQHPSPNAGIPEAVIAGMLGIRLGGVNYYCGEKSFRAYLGQQQRNFKINDITKVKNIILTASLLGLNIDLIFNLIIEHWRS